MDHEYTDLSYSSNGQILCNIDGKPSCIPVDEANRHYREIIENELPIQAYEPEPVSAEDIEAEANRRAKHVNDEYVVKSSRRKDKKSSKEKSDMQAAWDAELKAIDDAEDALLEMEIIPQDYRDDQYWP